MTALFTERAELRVVEGYVWCNRHGEIHNDTLDPYEYGAPDSGEEDQRCEKSDHRKVYARVIAS